MFKSLIIITFCALSSCNERQNLVSSQKTNRYYVRTNREHVDTLSEKFFAMPDSSFHISATKKVDSRFGLLVINKFTNEPNASTDGGMELFYEPSIGIFYSRSLTWPVHTRLHTNNDSLNTTISILIDRILADPELCNFPVMDTSKMESIKFKTPKIE